MAAGFLCRFYHLLMGCVRAAKLNIVLNSIVEQIHILKYHAHILQEAVTGKLFDIVAAYGNAAFLHIPKPGDQPCNGGFAASEGPTIAVMLPCGMEKLTSFKIGLPFS